MDLRICLADVAQALCFIHQEDGSKVRGLSIEHADVEDREDHVASVLDELRDAEVFCLSGPIRLSHCQAGIVLRTSRRKLSASTIASDRRKLSSPKS